MRETNSLSTLRLGFWSAILYAFLLVAFDITFVGGTAQLAGRWIGLEAYAQVYNPVDFAFAAIGFPVVFVFLIMLAAMHHHSEGISKVWSLLALAWGTMYAALLSILCFLQVGLIWPALMRGETAGLAPWLLADPTSLAHKLYYLAWGLGGLAFFCTGLVLRGRGLQRLTGWLWILNGLANIALVPLFVLRRDLLLYVAGPSWVLGLPLAALLLAAIYYRAAKTLRTDH